MQRKVGWSDAVQDGYAWNAGERQVGSIRRIPLEDLPVGLPNDAPIGSLTTEAAKLQYLHTAPRLRGFFTDLYKSPYADLEETIRGWFKKHASDLGAFARCLRANFMLTHVDVPHEELMRGLRSGGTRTAGILTALMDLDRPVSKSAADCPKMPEELEEEERQRKIQERKDRARPRSRAMVGGGMISSDARSARIQGAKLALPPPAARRRAHSPATHPGAPGSRS